MLRSVTHELCTGASLAPRHLLHTSSTAAAQLGRFRSKNPLKSPAQIQKLKPHVWRRQNFPREEAPHVDLPPGERMKQERNISFRKKRRALKEDVGGATSWSKRMQGEEGSRPGLDRETHQNLTNAVQSSIRLQSEPRTYEVDRRSVRLSRPSKPKDAPAKKVKNDLYPEEFSKEKTISDEVAQFGASFSSPPLLPGLLSCLEEILGPNATPTPIQASSLTWLLNTEHEPESGWKQFLLASETGSGKSIAYLLPLLQHLKVAELAQHDKPRTEERPKPRDPSLEREVMPRALILAPTHELSRQLSKTAKSLLHDVKLRVRCASQANMKSAKQRDFTARQLAAQLEGDNELGMFDIKGKKAPVDILVGTPMKVMEMYKGRGWNRPEDEPAEDESGKPADRRTARAERFGRAPRTPPLGLQNIEWVIVDEADVLFDPDFEQTTRQLLADISAARGKPVQYKTISSLSLENKSPEEASSTVPAPVNYPFNFILTSATIPSALARYLDNHHPDLLRLASPRLHALPKSLNTEYVGWTGGNKNSDIERRLRQVWAEDSVSPDNKGLSKVLIFCNKNTKIDDLASHLEEKGIKSIALSRDSDQRKWGNNRHLDGFVKPKAGDEPSESPQEITDSDPGKTPHVMITTSLLSRGIDFSPSVKHVFIVDEPRNMIDFLHRAGRTGRAGEGGKVVIFGRMQGRGSLKSKEIRHKVHLLSKVR